MYDINLGSGAAPAHLIGAVSGNDYFNEHREQWSAEIQAKLEEVGFPLSLWPTNTHSQNKIIYQCKAFGKLPRNLFTEVSFVSGEIHTESIDARIARRMEALPYIKNQFYVFTDGEDWWPYDKFFLVSDAESFLRYCTYETARADPAVLATGGTKNGRGRPRNTEAHATKEARAERYHAWLAECASYRSLVAEKKQQYLEARAVADKFRQELHELETAGAPKWMP